MNEPVPAAALVHAPRQVALVDLLDRLLAGGVVLSGRLTLRIADVDLVHIDLRALLTSVTAAPVQQERPEPAGEEAR